ncbi:MAG: hypothetical protein ACREIP_12320 [Alphaproteobacteria bacterium]
MAGFTVAFRDGQPYGPEQIAIDPNPGAPKSPTALTGPSYAALPSSFAQRHARTRSREVAKTPEILVAFGARDSANRTVMALDALARLLPRCRVTVVLGRHAIHGAAVTERVRTIAGAILHADIAAMDELYSAFDLAVGAPGVSQFERACCGLPSVLVAQNEIQEPLCRAWAEVGAAIAERPDVDMIAETVDGLLSDLPKLAAMRKRCLDLVDGKGAERIAQVLKQRVRLELGVR